MSFRSLSMMFSMMILSVALFLGLTMSPSLAAKMSDPTQGTAQMPETMKAAEDVANKPVPMTIKEIEERNKGGLNEVQGSADADKMYGGNSLQNIPPVVKEAEKAMSKKAKK
jgi:hypothetical protein